VNNTPSTTPSQDTQASESTLPSESEGGGQAKAENEIGANGITGTVDVPPIEQPKQEETVVEEPKQEETPVYKYGCSCGYLATSYDDIVNHMKGHVLKGEPEHFGTVYN
jgi:hypothetical protein